MDDGTNIVLRRHGNPRGPRLVLCHGNGLATDLYYPFWSLLADECDLIVYDLSLNPPIGLVVGGGLMRWCASLTWENS